MTSSESPTHPDAPRAGGEAPDSRPALDLEAKCSVCSHDREMHGDDAPNLLGCGMIGCQCSAFDGRFAAPPSLLARHRDGERETPAASQEPNEGRDWPEDFAHENGDYWNTCISCGCIFRGRKRRVSCKVCNVVPPAPNREATNA